MWRFGSECVNKQYANANQQLAPTLRGEKFFRAANGKYAMQALRCYMYVP